MIGQTISHYKILEKLGEGGMGVVYKALDTKLNRNVALKFLPSFVTEDAEEKARFLHEAQALSSLNHPHIATIYDVEEAGDQKFIALEYIEGGTLKKKVKHKQLPLRDALEYAIQVAEGLAYAHKKQIVHRDIKTDNMMMTSEDQIKITDFGLAKLKGTTKVTKIGSTVGTAAYMSPEQAQGEEADHRSDIFSFGVVLHELITGEVPFKGEHEAALLYEVVNTPIKALKEVRSDVPDELERIISKATEKSASDRYQRVDEMIIDLKRLKKEFETKEILRQTGVRVAVQKKKSPWLVPASVAAGVAVLVVGYFLFQPAAESGERIPLAVIDIVNETKEEELDGLSGLLITSLEQSRRLSVLTRSRMFDILRQLGKGDVNRIDEKLGREVCKEANVNALVIASIRKFGRLYTIDLKILDPQRNEYLYTTTEKGEGQESIPVMIDKLSEKTRVGLKEKAAEIQAASQKVAEVTTPNLEAYQHYFLGEQLMDRAEFKEAEAEYRKAIELDPTFGLAYYRLAYAINWYGTREQAKVSIQKALDLIDRIPEKERYLVRGLNAEMEKGFGAGIAILKEMERVYPKDKEMLYNIGDWSYHANRYATAADYLEKVLAIDPTFERALQHLMWTYGDLGREDKSLEYANRLLAVNKKEGMLAIGRYHALKGERATAADYYEKAHLMDPTDEGTLSNLTRIYEDMRQYVKALEYAKKYVSQASNPIAYGRLATMYILMSDFSNALQTYELGLQLFPDDPSLLVGKGRAYTFSGDYEKAEVEFKAMTAVQRTDEVRKQGYLRLARFYSYTGEYSEMMKMYDKRIELDWEDSDSTDVAFRTVEKAAQLHWGRRNKEDALREIEKTMNFNNIVDEDYHGRLADLYYQIGEFEKAEIAAKKVQSRGWKMELDARTHYAKKEWDQALSLYESLIERFPFFRSYYGYLAAQCYFEKGELDKALEAIKGAQGYYGSGHDVVFTKGFFLRGKINEKKGNTKLAIENYEKFLDLWKNADKDLPDLLDAKARLAKLKGIAAR